MKNRQVNGIPNLQQRHALRRAMRARTRCLVPCVCVQGTGIQAPCGPVLPSLGTSSAPPSLGLVLFCLPNKEMTQVALEFLCKPGL